MKKILIFVAALMAVSSSLSAEKVPSLVIGHYYGNDTYPVSLTDFNRIEVGDDHYTLKANNTNVKDQVLSYSQYPRFWVENVEKDDIVTSENKIEVPGKETLVVYNPNSHELRSFTGERFSAEVYTIGGRMVMRGAATRDGNISVELLPAGIYIANTQTEGKTITIKFAKQ